MTLIEMIEKFQCPGCVNGPSPETCPQYEADHQSCKGHVVGTLILGVGHVALGLPKGFNRVTKTENPHSHIRLFPKDSSHWGWDKLNVAVWALEQDGFLFVRTYCPRIDVTYVDVFEGKTFMDCPVGCYNVESLIKEID